VTATSSRTLALGSLVVLVVVYLLHPTGDWGVAAYLVASLGAAVVAWWGAAVNRGPDRRAAKYIALAVTFSAIAEVIGVIEEHYANGTDFFVADIGWLMASAVLVVALAALARRPGLTGRHHMSGMLDVATLVVVMLLIEWQYAVTAFLRDGELPVFVRFGSLLYPVLDTLIIAMAVRVLVLRRGREAAPLMLLLGGVIWLAVDLAYLFAPSTVSYQGWTSGLWLVACAVFAAAAWDWPTSAPVPRDSSRATATLGLALILGPLLVPGAIEIGGYLTDNPVNPVPLFLATIVLVGLAFVRSRRLLFDEMAARQELRSQSRYAEALAANSSDAAVVLDATGRIQSDPSALSALLARPVGGIDRADLFAALQAYDPIEGHTVFGRVIRTPGGVHVAELRVRHGAGRDMWLSIRMVNLLFDPDVRGVLANIHDITHRKSAEEELTHRAFHDGLTGLANRVLFVDRTEQALRRTARTAQDVAVVYLDLDGFKNVNDSMGHECGDELLRAVARRIQGEVRSEDTVARLGGDEFAVLVEESERVADEAEAVAERIVRALAVPIHVGDRTYAVSASLGIAISEPTSFSSSLLLRDADLAMYRAKALGRGRIVRFDGSMRVAAMERLQLESDLVDVVASGELRLMFQPVVELDSGRTTGFEALLRWDHPLLGTLAPDRFVAIAEETGAIVPVGRWAIEQACRTVAGWRRDHPHASTLTVAVNVSPAQLADPGLVDAVAAILADTGLPARALVLEITESSLVADPDGELTALEALRRLGVRVAVDGFGIGYSALGALRRMPVDILKIDRSFVATITSPAHPPAIVRGLFALGRTLELQVVGEGVETEAQRDALRAQGCLLAQGFLFAAPLPVAEAAAMLAAGPSTTSAVSPGR
jgi:diguanylate cyclase (GGDEF)-like protein